MERFEKKEAQKGIDQNEEMTKNKESDELRMKR